MKVRQQMLFLNKLKLYNIKKILWILCLSLFVSLLISSQLFFIPSGKELTSFDSRSIGYTVLKGIDSSNFSKEYICMLISFLLSFFMVFCGLSVLNNFIMKKLSGKYIYAEKQAIYLLSIFSIVLLILYHLNNGAVRLYLNLIAFLSTIILINLCLIFIKSFFYKKSIISNMLKSNIVIFISLILPFIFFFIYNVLFNGNFSIKTEYLLWYFLLVSISLLLIVLAGVILTKIMFHVKHLINAFTISMIPLLFIPLSIPLSNELQYTLSEWVNISPRFLSLIFISILGLFSIFLFSRSIRKNLVINKSKYIQYIYFPLLVAIIATYKFYQPTLVLNSLDLFHFGEITLPTHQLFHFGKIPFIDIFPTHQISDMFTQTLYALLNGVKGIDFILWQYVMRVVTAILFYYLILSITKKPLFSFLASIILSVLFTEPILLGRGSFLIIIVMLCLPRLIKVKVGFHNYVLLWLFVFFVTLWRFDFGVFLILSILATLFLIYLKDLKLEQFVNYVKYVLLSFLLVFSILFLFYIILLLITEHSFNKLYQVMKWLTFQSETMGRVAIMRDFSFLALLQYFIIPFFTLSFVIYFIYKIIKRETNFRRHQYVILFIAIISLIFSMRGLQRHSLYEQYSSYLFPLLVCLAPFYFTYKLKKFANTLFLSFFIVYVFIYPAGFTHNITIFPDNLDTLFVFKQWEHREQRVLIKNKSQYSSLKRFFDKHLDVDQTFYDFSNAPMLYVFTDRKFPSFIIPNLYQTSETIQKSLVRDLEKQYEEDKLIYIIFKQGTWWDDVDMVPNEVRSYRVAEYIYRNFRPLGKIDNYEIWVKNRYYNQYNTTEGKNFTELKINKLSKIITKDIKKQYIDDGSLISITDEGDPYFLNFLDLSNIDITNKTKINFNIKYSSDVDGKLQVFYSFDNEKFNAKSSLYIDLDKGVDNQASIEDIPISGKKVLSNIRFDPPINSTFILSEVKIDFTHIDLLLFKNEAHYKNNSFNLFKLPYIWGTYDEYKAVENTSIIQSYHISDADFDFNELILYLEEVIPKKKGNYIYLNMKTNTKMKIILEYGEIDDKSKNFVTLGKFSFDTKNSDMFENYMIRSSMQYNWMNEEIDYIKVITGDKNKIDIKQIDIREGD